MGSTFGLAFQLVIIYIFFILICSTTCNIKGASVGWRISVSTIKALTLPHVWIYISVWTVPYSRWSHGPVSCAMWLHTARASNAGGCPSFLRYVITYSKGEQRRWKHIRNLRKFVDVIRCINLYIEKLYCVWNMYGIRWWILVYVNMCLMMYLINFYLCVWWL
jgi:hypothetical protein